MDRSARLGRRFMAYASSTAVLLLLLAGPALAVTTPTNPEPDIACPGEFGTGLLTRYVTTVNTPADSTDWWVSIEFELGDANGESAACQLSLGTYELAGPTFSLPQTLFDSDTGTFGAGTHTLTATLPREAQMPGCFAQYDFVFGPTLDTLDGSQKYGDRQIRARIVGSEQCPEEGGVGAQTPTATPEGTVAAGTGTPEQSVSGDLPDTSTAPFTGGGMVIVFGLVFATSLAAIGFIRLRANPTRD